MYASERERVNYFLFSSFSSSLYFSSFYFILLFIFFISLSDLLTQILRYLYICYHQVLRHPLFRNYQNIYVDNCREWNDRWTTYDHAAWTPWAACLSQVLVVHSPNPHPIPNADVPVSMAHLVVPIIEHCVATSQYKKF